MNPAYIRRLNYWLVGIISCALILSLSVIVVISLRMADKYVVPELEAKAVTQGQALTSLIGQPLSFGIGIRDLVGIEDLFKGVIKENPEFGFLALSGTTGEVLYSLGNLSREVRDHLKNPALLKTAATTAENGLKPKAAGFNGHHVISLPIFSKERSVAGLLHIGIKSSFVQNILQELLLDLAVIFIVSLFVAYEILYFITGGKLAGQFELLTGVLGAVANHDFSRRIPHIGRDELGRVAALADAAISRINLRFHKLRSNNIPDILQPDDGVGLLRANGYASIGLSADTKFGEPDSATTTHTNYLGALRAPIFLSFMAEELSRSFIPLYTKQLYEPIPGITAEFVMGLPIMVFMSLTLLQPVLGGWSDRVGRKHSLLIGMLVGCLAFIMTANAFGLYDLLFWRALAGVSWAIVFVASQGLVLDHATADSRTRDIAFFLGVYMVAYLCGPPIGGILADNLGYRATFYVAAGLSLVAMTILYRFLPGDKLSDNVAHRKLKLAEIMSVLANRRFLTLVLTAGIPAKIALASICYYLIPLYIRHTGYSVAMTGRILMMYGIMMVVVVPLAARTSDHMRKRKEFIGVGLILSGIAGFLIQLGSSIYVSIAIVSLLGMAQATSIAPQTAFVADICPDEIRKLGEGTVYGVYRLMERIGNFLGPFVAALLLNYTSFTGAFSSIGLLLLICGVVFISVFRRSENYAITAVGGEGVEQ